MFKIVAMLVVMPFVAVLMFAATISNWFTVKRTISIKAPPEKIFALISDFRTWASWSPYEKLDPDMKKTYNGAANGKGAGYEWEGNRKAGKGRIEITETSPLSRITMKLDMIKPFKAENIVEFTLEPQSDSTKVTWSMDGRMGYVAKITGIFVNINHRLGKEFDLGLASLKAIAER